MAILGDNNNAVVKMRKLLKGKPGRPPKDADKTRSNPTELTVDRGRAYRGRAYTLDRLTRERPDLRARVDAKELTANAAAIEAGFRPKTFTVRADDPDKIVATLRRQLPPEVQPKRIKPVAAGRFRRRPR